MNEPAANPRVLVTGDVFLDHHIYVGHHRWPHTSLKLGSQIQFMPGGAALLSQILGHFLPKWKVNLGLDSKASDRWPCSFSVFDRFPANSAVPEPEQVWRMREALGFETPRADSTALVSENLHDEHDMVVIDDAGLTYRRTASQDAWPSALLKSDRPPPAWLVLKLHAPIAAGDLWHHLVADPRSLLKQCVAVVPCNELRSEEVRITPGLSWERTALDLAGEFLHNPTLAALRLCRFVVVRFDTDGALLADFSDADQSEFRLIFDPAHLEGDWTAQVAGRIYGYHTAFAAAVAATLVGSITDASEARLRLEEGIASGLAVTRRLLLAGHGSAAGPPAFPFPAIEEEFHRSPHSWEYSVTSVSMASPHWSIAASDPSGAAQATPLFGLAHRVALNGVSALRGLPFQRFGNLFIVDRGEIEALRGLRQLVADYVRQGVAKRPLSIAVFGAPGAGKSFGVRELTRAVLGEKVPILEFNLAQFDSTAELLGLLHQVRDKVLEGRMPVVFWDEFDSKELKWLQYLLAPMQDGRIQDGQISHPIGKCVFIFAGGTSSEFARFGPAEPGKNADSDEQQAWDKFRASKGPDFRSRLNGYLDVLGPNPRRTPTGEDDPADVSFPLRRALLLRSKLGLLDSERLTIDRGVLSALLEVSRYTHGARSMEKIIEQAKAGALPGGVIGRSHLPPRQLLELHVDAGNFMDLVERDLKFQFDVEPAAKAYHRIYLELARSRGWKIDFDFAFEDLPEFIKDDNRAAARRVCDVVGLIGLYVVPIGQSTPTVNDDENRRVIRQNLELLAEAEHDGWVAYRLRNGWKRGETKNVDLRVSNGLVPYAELSETDREKDREAVRRYVDILGEAGYKIISSPPHRQPTG
jgi:hypothetical protein